MKSESALDVPGSDLSQPSPMTPLAMQLLSLATPYVGTVNMNLGCGVAGVIPGWVNVDRTPGPGVDMVMNLEDFGRYPNNLALARAGSVDCVIASHVLEHIRDLIPLMREIHRVLRPGGHLVAITPHAGSDDAWEDPTHVRAFTERSWSYFDRRIYEAQAGHGSYRSPVDFCFEVVNVGLTPQQWRWEEYERLSLTEEQVNARMQDLVRRERNVIGEIIAILRKME